MTKSQGIKKLSRIPLISELNIVHPVPDVSPSSSTPIVTNDSNIFICCRAMLVSKYEEALISNDGKIIGIVYLVEALPIAFQTLDVIEQSLIIAERAESRAQAIEASLHLEIKTHLSTIISAIQSSKLGQDLPRELRKIETATKAVASLLGTFESVSVKEPLKNQQELSDLNQFVTQLVSAIQPNAKLRAMNIVFAPDQNIKVPLYRKPMAQAMRTFLEEMIRSQFPGSTLVIETSFRPRLKSGDAIIKIFAQCHNIVGFSSALQNDPHATLMSGLVHTLLREAVYSQGGQLSVDSENENAATYVITLPEAQAIPIKDQIFATPKVLVVEDDADVLNLLSEIVQSRGYTVIKACDGVDALDKFKQEKPTLVLADVRMPRLDGIELAEAIKAIDEKIPIILFSGQYPNLMEDRLDRKIKADHVLYKPFATSDVIESLSLFLPD